MIRRLLLPVSSAVATAFWAGGAPAQSPSWLAVCNAIQPSNACGPENRTVVERAIENCRGASDKPACYRYELVPLPEADRTAPRPAILRGTRGQ